MSSFINPTIVKGTRAAFTDATADLRYYIESHDGGKALTDALQNLLKASAAWEEWVDPGDFDSEAYAKEIMDSLPQRPQAAQSAPHASSPP